MTPKEQFLKSSHAKAFADIAGTDTFREAMNYAVLALAERPGKLDIDHRSFFAGVNALKTELSTIATPEEPAQIELKQSLNHNAYDSPARPGLISRTISPSKPSV